MGELFEPLLQLAAQGVVAIHQHFGQQLVEPVDDRVRHPLVQPGPAQQRVGALVHHVAHQLLIVFEAEARPAHQRIDQRQVALVGNGVLQQLARQRRDVEPLQLHRKPAAHLSAQPFGIERLEHFGEQLARARPDARSALRVTVGKVIARGPGNVHRPHPPRDHLGGEEIVAQELRHGVGDAVLVFRDDRGVRDRQSQRAAKQCGDGEPVRQPADHRRLAEGVDIAPGRVARLQVQREDEHHRHQRQHSGGDDAHAPCGIGRHGSGCGVSPDHARGVTRPDARARWAAGRGRPVPHDRLRRPRRPAPSGSRPPPGKSAGWRASTGRRASRSPRQG